MGKSAEEVALPVAADENAATRCPQCRPIGKIVSLRCVAALVLSAAVLISAVFWLPPFIRGSHGGRGRHRGEAYRGSCATTQFTAVGSDGGYGLVLVDAINGGAEVVVQGACTRSSEIELRLWIAPTGDL